MRNIYILIGAIATLAACSSTKTIPATFVEPQIKLQKWDKLVLIDDRALKDLKVTANPGLVELNVIYGDALSESIKEKIANQYAVVAVQGFGGDEKFDYQIKITNEISSACSGMSCDLMSRSIVDIKNSQGETVLDKMPVVDSFTWIQPASATVVGFISGLTIIGAPIGILLGIDIENQELKNQVVSSNERMSTKIFNVVHAHLSKSIKH